MEASGGVGGAFLKDVVDYFSPDNLKERNSERLPPEAQQLASPSLFHCRGLSKWERRNMLEMCDFTCIGEKHRSISSISDLISKSASSLEKPVKEEVNTASTCLLLVETSANDSPGLCSQPGPQLRDDTGPEGSSHPDTLSSSAHHITPLKGNSTETRDPGDGKGSPKEGSTPPASASPEDEVHICNLSLGEDCNVEKSVEEKENIATGYSESVKNGPGRPDPSDSSCTGLVRPQQKPKKSEKEEKPTRTLVMTSMPSEKQTLIIQVVSTLKGFSFAPEVCETTTHVLVGKSARTLNVLMGIARGCWILSYEWVLLSLELGHWISEVPDEKLCLSPTMSIIEEHQVRLGPKNSSAKRKRAADLGSSPKGKLKKRYKRKSALAIQLFKSDQSPPSTIRLIPGTPDVEASSYEDYFSPDNLKERNSERLPPEAQQLASPSLFHCRGLSKWERRNMLEMCDFTCIGEKHRSISSISDLISIKAYSL